MKSARVTNRQGQALRSCRGLRLQQRVAGIISHAAGGSGGGPG
eukprot:COSAG01_NODE_48781_length_378_cov_0.573477_1_plen_42_part_10